MIQIGNAEINLGLLAIFIEVIAFIGGIFTGNWEPLFITMVFSIIIWGVMGVTS